MPHTRFLKCFVLITICCKTKHFRSLVRAIIWLEIQGLSLTKSFFLLTSVLKTWISCSVISLKVFLDWALGGCVDLDVSNHDKYMSMYNCIHTYESNQRTPTKLAFYFLHVYFPVLTFNMRVLSTIKAFINTIYNLFYYKINDLLPQWNSTLYLS